MSPSQPVTEEFDHETGSYIDPEPLDGKVGGIHNAEAAYKFYGRISKWFLFFG